MRVTAIAALSDNGVIGKSGGLPWHIPEDLQRFKAFTKGKSLVMGRKTWVSIGEKPLPGRKTFVLSASLNADAVNGATLAASLKEAVGLAEMSGASELVVVGGAALYAEAMPLIDLLSLTRVHTEIENGDVFFPSFDRNDFQLIKKEAFAGGGFQCTYEEWSAK